MAGPWLYVISKGHNRFFNLADGPIPVSVDRFRELIENGRIVEDRYWDVRHGKDVKEHDELYLYAGTRDGDLGIIGYATVGHVERRSDGWCILPRFDLPRSRALLANPVPAAVVREWRKNLRPNVINIEPFKEQLRVRLPWAEQVVEADAELKHVIERTLAAAQGQRYESDPVARKAVEDYAVGLAIQYFREREYQVEERGKPFDLMCSKTAHNLFVEVKGSQTPCEEIALTPNEVQFARDHRSEMALFVVHSIRLDRDAEKYVARGGVPILFFPWSPEHENLKPAAFLYRLPSRGEVLQLNGEPAANLAERSPHSPALGGLVRSLDSLDH